MKIDRRHLPPLFFMGMLALSAAGCSPARKDQARPPNIILVLIDDMGWTGPSCFGNKHAGTPNIDRLAVEGMKFTQAYTAPVCSPTRCEILTGKYSARFGITKAGPDQSVPWSRWLDAEMSLQLPFEEYTLAESLRDLGYATGHVGKWHVGIGHPGNRSGSIGDPQDLGLMDQHFGWDYSAPAEGMNYDKGVRDLTDKGIAFVERNQGRRFFLYLAHHSVHTEIFVPEEYTQKYLDRGYPKAGPDQAEGVDTADYFAFIDYLDEHTGRLLDRLDALGLAGNTLVVFLSDNGGLTRVTRNDPLRRGKGMCYEGGIRVPMLVRWPGVVQPGEECDTPVHAVDLYPTILEAAGGSARSDHAFDGRSLLPLLTKAGNFPARNLYWHMPHYICDQKGFFGVTPHSAIRSGDYKLMEFYHDYLEVDPQADYRQDRARYVPDGRIELYNIRQDIGEKRDLAAELPGKVGELRKALAEWRLGAGAKLPRPNPDYDPSRHFPGRP